MKKKSTLALVMVLMLASVMMLSACGNPSVVTTTEGLAEYFDEIKAADSFTAKLTVSQSYDGDTQKATIELKKDGNKFKLTMKDYSTGEVYEETVYVEINEEKGGVCVYLQQYDYDDYTWYKEEISIDEFYAEISPIISELPTIYEELFGTSENPLLNAERYTFSEEDDCFILDEEGFNKEIFDMIEVTLKVTEDKATMSLIFEDMRAQIPENPRINIKIKLELYKLDETTVKLPNVK